MKKIIPFLFILMLSGFTKAQLSGNLNVPANYTSVTSVIAALNQQGISGNVIINIAAGHTETAVTGGYVLTASGNSINSIIFQKSGAGANPLLVAYSGGNGTPGSMNQDGIWRFIGCDYVTVDGIDLLDPNTSNPSTMEFNLDLIGDRVRIIQSTWREKFPMMNFQVNQLKTDSLLNFNHSFVLQIEALNLEAK